MVPSSADVRDLREALRWHSERIDELHGMCTLVASGMCTLVASAQCCSLESIWSQPPVHLVAASLTYGCSLHHIRLQAAQEAMSSIPDEAVLSAMEAPLLGLLEP